MLHEGLAEIVLTLSMPGSMNRCAFDMNSCRASSSGFESPRLIARPDVASCGGMTSRAPTWYWSGPDTSVAAGARESGASGLTTSTKSFNDLTMTA